MFFLSYTGITTEASFVAIVMTILVMICFYSIKHSKRIAAPFSHTHFIYLYRTGGFILFGLIPVLVMYVIFNLKMVDFGLSFKNLTNSLIWILGLSIPTIFLSFLISKYPKNLNFYPQIRDQEWKLQTFFLSSFTWILYLIGYEILFRGILLFSCIEELGNLIAVLLNVLLYSIAHIPKGKQETIAAIPVGLMLCYITLSTGTIWAALGIHIMMALTNEWFSFYHQKQMRFVSLKINL